MKLVKLDLGFQFLFGLKVLVFWTNLVDLDFQTDSFLEVHFGEIGEIGFGVPISIGFLEPIWLFWSSNGFSWIFWMVFFGGICQIGNGSPFCLNWRNWWNWWNWWNWIGGFDFNLVLGQCGFYQLTFIGIFRFSNGFNWIFFGGFGGFGQIGNWRWFWWNWQVGDNSLRNFELLGISLDKSVSFERTKWQPEGGTVPLFRFRIPVYCYAYFGTFYKLFFLFYLATNYVWRNGSVKKVHASCLSSNIYP